MGSLISLLVLAALSLSAWTAHADDCRLQPPKDLNGFAALFAPKPQGMNTANDWTKEIATKGFPELQKLYATFGYNHTLFAQRTHDVLTVVTYLRKAQAGSRPNPEHVAVAGWGDAGPIVAAARALAGAAIDRAAMDTKGFRFGKVLDYRDPMFLPGGAKYLDVPGLIALNAPHPLWLAGEGDKPEVFGAKFTELTSFAGEATQKEASAVEWLLK
jgi:hypothetical protein